MRAPRPGRLGPAALLVLAMWLLGCGGAQGRTDGIGKDDGIIVVRSNVADAEIWVNERRLGFVADLDGGIALSPGQHRLEVRHDRYHTHYQLLDLAPDARLTLDVELAEVLD